MNVVRKMINTISTGFFAVLNFIFFVRPGSQQADWPSSDESIGTSLDDVHNAQIEFGKKLQADREDRRRRGHDQYHGYNW